ncbi:MAG: SUMF1/EgtB/PvdO family nonheme iron enzyme [Polyangiaceae bacterium]|nr:SUMF1/EgtB/PvdO family nonheme iron enzyme [Polyangiaceae bacterium]
MRCDPNDDSQTYCDLTELPDPAASTDEICNGIDDKCNGQIDEGVVDEMVHVVDTGLDFWMYIYETSRPDASLSDPEARSARACSNTGVLLWSNVSWTDASIACIAAGKRLCTEDEWQLGCEGLAQNTYPYGSVYEPGACNGADLDPDCSGLDDDVVAVTGALHGCDGSPALCQSGFGTLDMSGNLMEWRSSEMSPSSDIYLVRGGAYGNIEGGLSCQFNFISVELDFQYGNLGLRCCSDDAP